MLKWPRWKYYQLNKNIWFQSLRSLGNANSIIIRCNVQTWMELCMPGAQQVGPLTSNYVTSVKGSRAHFPVGVYILCYLGCRYCCCCDISKSCGSDTVHTLYIHTDDLVEGITLQHNFLRYPCLNSRFSVNEDTHLNAWPGDGNQVLRHTKDALYSAQDSLPKSKSLVDKRIKVAR